MNLHFKKKVTKIPPKTLMMTRDYQSKQGQYDKNKKRSINIMENRQQKGEKKKTSSCSNRLLSINMWLRLTALYMEQKYLPLFF